MRCGLCCQAAVTEWWHPDWDLERHLCGHHTHTEAPTMVGAGWAQVEDWRDPHRPALSALSADPASH